MGKFPTRCHATPRVLPHDCATSRQQGVWEGSRLCGFQSTGVPVLTQARRPRPVAQLARSGHPEELPVLDRNGSAWERPGVKNPANRSPAASRTRVRANETGRAIQPGKLGRGRGGTNTSILSPALPIFLKNFRCPNPSEILNLSPVAQPTSPLHSCRRLYVGIEGPKRPAFAGRCSAG